MKKMNKLKKFASLLFCSVMVLNTTACNSTSDDIVQQTGSRRITCSWWGNDGRNSYTMEGLSVFHELNPDIMVDGKYGIWDGYTKRQNIYMNSHDEPDVMQINHNWLKKFSPDGDGFYDLYTLSDYIDLSNYTESELAYGEVNGKLNAIPIAFNTQTIYCNSDLYEKYNLDIPSEWDDFFDAAKVMRKDDIYPLGMGAKSLFFFLVANWEQKTGKSVCDAEGNLVVTKDDIGYMLDFYKRMFDEEVIMPISTTDFNTFTAGKTASIVRWISDSESYCSPLTQKGVKVVVAPYPTYKDAKKLGWYVKPATMYSISSTTEHPEESAKLLNFLVNSKEMALLQQTEKGIPISKSAKQALVESDNLSGLELEGDTLLNKNQDKMQVMYPVLEAENVYQAFKDEADFYLYGRDTRENVVDKIYTSFYAE